MVGEFEITDKCNYYSSSGLEYNFEVVFPFYAFHYIFTLFVYIEHIADKHAQADLKLINFQGSSLFLCTDVIIHSKSLLLNYKYPALPSLVYDSHNKVT